MMNKMEMCLFVLIGLLVQQMIYAENTHILMSGGGIKAEFGSVSVEVMRSSYVSKTNKHTTRTTGSDGMRNPQIRDCTWHN